MIVASLGTFLAGAKISWTLLIALFAVCLTAMATLIKIFGKNVTEEDIDRIEKENKEIRAKHESLKDAVGGVQTEVAILKERSKNGEKTLDGMKQDNREVVQRLDDLLKQLIEFLND